MSDTPSNKELTVRNAGPGVVLAPPAPSRYVVPLDSASASELNHSNIAAIYGLEESGDVSALVIELVEGLTLFFTLLT